MAIAKKDITPEFVDKRDLLAIVDQQYREMGIAASTDETPERIRLMMAALGIRPDENLFSRNIIAAREGRS